MSRVWLAKSRRLLGPFGVAVSGLVVTAVILRPNAGTPGNLAVAPSQGRESQVAAGPEGAPTTNAWRNGPQAVPPGVVRGPFGTSDTSAYQGAPLTRLAQVPAVTGQFAATLHSEATYLGLRSPDELAAISRLVVRGRVVAFSAPYWNSDGGAFWSPRYLPQLEQPVPNALYRDVTFEVFEVLGDKTGQGIALGTITFTVQGGQAVVDIPEDVASIDPTFLPSGRYLWRFDPHVDLALDEEAVIFLDYRELPGLYDGKYGYLIKLMPAHESFFKFTVGAQGEARNGALGAAATGGPFITNVARLRDLAASKNLGAAVRRPLVPDSAVHPMPSPHAEEPVFMPPDEQDAGPTPDPGEGSYQPAEP